MMLNTNNNFHMFAVLMFWESNIDWNHVSGKQKLLRFVKK
jgi:hypothetical protein